MYRVLGSDGCGCLKSRIEYSLPLALELSSIVCDSGERIDHNSFGPRLRRSFCDFSVSQIQQYLYPLAYYISSWYAGHDLVCAAEPVLALMKKCNRRVPATGEIKVMLNAKP